EVERIHHGQAGLESKLGDLLRPRIRTQRRGTRTARQDARSRLPSALVAVLRRLVRSPAAMLFGDAVRPPVSASMRWERLEGHAETSPARPWGLLRGEVPAASG